MPDNEKQPKLNIYIKLQQCKVDLSKKKIKKSGKNPYVGYEYFELDDFLPHIFQAEFDNGLYSKFEFNLERATLKVVDTDSSEGDFELFSMPVKLVSMEGNNEMQNIAATQSFCERYLYQIAYGIVANDTVDSGKIDKDQELSKKKINKAAVDTIKKLITEISMKESEFCKWAKVKSIGDITNKELHGCMQELNKKKEILLKDKQNKIPDEIDF